MGSPPLTRTIDLVRGLATAGLILGAGHCGAAGAAESPFSRYVGAAGCASSSCHGGAGENRNAWVLWNQRDVHRRAQATLTAARARQIAQAAGLGDPVTATRCTVCHAPFHDVPETQRLVALPAAEGVSCESCHGPAERWLRSHTRSDFTATDRAADGLRPLGDLAARASACVACHENVDEDLLAAGHPELRFELDGQTLAQPRHWKEATHYHGAQAWLVGQLVAARELAWQAARTQPAPARLAARADGAQWLVAKAAAAAGIVTAPGQPEERARAAAALTWTPARTAALLQALAGTAADFRDPAVPRAVQARRAERLVLGLDRLLAASDPALERKLDPQLDELFRRAQSLPDFDPPEFAEALERFAARLP